MPDDTKKPQDPEQKTTDKQLDEISGGVPAGPFAVQGHPPDGDTTQDPQANDSQAG